MQLRYNRKLIHIIFFLIPIILSFICVYTVDNDIWYLLSEGRYIVQNGIYHVDPLSMHEGFDVVVQNWASASLFWLVFSFLGKSGLLLMVVVVNFLICLLMYKICMLLSNKNFILSLLLMLVNDLVLIRHYLVTRPQILSFIILLSLIYLLELYIKTNNSKYLITIPVLSIAEANLHASLWLMIFLFMIPYIIDGMKLRYINTQKYRLKPLLITFFLSLLTGLINPYGYKIVIFIFNSFFNQIMHLLINELHSYSFSFSGLNFLTYCVVTVTLLAYIYFRKGKIRIRYICLYFGTLLLGLMSYKGLNCFFLVAIFPFAYFFKDLFPRSMEGIRQSFVKVFNILTPIICLLCIAAFISISIYGFKNFEMDNDARRVFNELDKYTEKGQKIYSSFNYGGYAEFRGYKPYIDPRAEVFLKSNNHKEDILSEFYLLSTGKKKYKTFINKYNFEYMLINHDDALVLYMLDEDDQYFIIAEDPYNRFRIYARKDLFTEEQINEITNRIL